MKRYSVHLINGSSVDVTADHFYTGVDFARFWADSGELEEVLTVNCSQIVTVELISVQLYFLEAMWEGPRHIGPFATQQAALDHATATIADGAFEIVPLTAPAPVG